MGKIMKQQGKNIQKQSQSGKGVHINHIICNWFGKGSQNKIVNKQQMLSPNQNKLKKNLLNKLLFFKIIIAFLSFGGISLLIFDIYHFYQYLVISKQIQMGQQVDEGLLLKHLEILTWKLMPFNSFFYEEKIQQLAKLHQWDRLISQANKALSYACNSELFSIHYHKALALCQKQQLSKCKEATIEAVNYATKQQFYYLKDIYDTLLSNGLIMANEIPSDESFFSGYKQPNGDKQQIDFFEENLLFSV